MAKKGRSNNRSNQKARRRERGEEKPKKKSGILGKILCLLLGFIMGIVGTLGGIVGLGYYAVAKVHIKDAVGTVNDLAGLEIDYTQYINAQYGDSTVLGLVETIVGTVGQLQDGTGTLNTLNQISPMVGKSVQTLIDSATEFGITIDYNALMSTPFSTLGDFLGETVKNTNVARLIEKTTNNPVEGVLAIICYGEPGEDYITLEDGTIKMLGNSTPATIDTLTNSDLLSKRLNNLTFYSLVEAIGDTQTSDPINRALIYGEENVDFVVNADGSITPLPKTYQLNADPEAMTFTSPDGVEFTKVDDSLWKDANENIIQQCEDCEGTPEYQYEVFNANAELICSLKLLRADSNLQYYQVYVDDIAQTRKGPYISEVFGTNANLLSIIGTLPLGDILKLTANSDSIVLAVAYGEKDVDYRIENNKIIPINPPTTVNDLMGGTNGTEIIKDIPLGTALNVNSPLQADTDKLMITLVYGKEGVNYELLDTDNDGVNDDWKWLKDENGKEYSENTIGYLMDGNGNSMFNEMTIETLLNIDANSAPIMRALAYGNEGTHYVLTEVNTNGDTPRTVVKMLPKRYYYRGTEVYNEEYKLVSSVVEEVRKGIFSVKISEEVTEYIKANPNGGYDVFSSLEDAQNYTESNDTRQYYRKTQLRDMRGSSAQNYIDRIELAAAMDVDIFTEDTSASNSLMIQLAYGAEGIHYTLDRENKQIIWLQDNDPDSETYEFYYHARTIRDMKDTHSLLKSVYLDTVLDLTYESPAFMLALAYGNDYIINADNTISYDPSNRRTVGDLMGTNSDKLIRDIEMRKIINNVDPDDAMMNYILYNMTHPVEGDPDYEVRKLGDFMDNSSKIIDGMIDALTLQEALGEDATKKGQLLYHLKDVKLCDLSTEVQKLSIQTVMDKEPDDSIYTYAEINGEWVKAVEVAENVWREVEYTDNEDGTRTWTFVDNGTAAPSPLMGAWKYLLKDSSGTEHLYALADMNEAMDNIPQNIDQATLNDLHGDGLIKLEGEKGDILNKGIVNKVGENTVYSGTKVTLGELTVSEMIDYLNELLTAVANP